MEGDRAEGLDFPHASREIPGEALTVYLTLVFSQNFMILTYAHLEKDLLRMVLLYFCQVFNNFVKTAQYIAGHVGGWVITVLVLWLYLHSCIM